MKFFRKLSLVFFVTLMAAKCQLPEVKEYAYLTKEMSQSIRQTATQIIDLLGQGYYARKNKSPEIDAAIAADLNALLGRDAEVNSKDYPEILRRNWKSIFRTLEQMVNYADALAEISESGKAGKESFENLANSLNGLASVAGFGTISQPVTEAGKFIYGKIAAIRASKKLEEVIDDSDTVIQVIGKRLDEAIASMKEVNDVAENENLLNIANSKDNQRIRNYFESLIDKEKFNIEKLTLINRYDNGDRTALTFFVYHDPQSLDKLAIKDLQAEIKRIQENGELSPRQKLDSIATISEVKFESRVKAALNNHVIVNSININQRLKEIQSDLDFVRAERIKLQSQYDLILESEAHIQTAANVNREFIEKSRKVIETWVKQHHNLKGFFNQKQSFSYSTLTQYVEDIQELNTIVKNLNGKENGTNDTP